MTTILCPNMIEFFAVKNALKEKGLTYVPNQKIPVSRGTNYIKVDSLGLFSLISKQEYDNLNDTE